MTWFRLILRNFQYYWQKNLLLALGIAISAAVLTGALIVGDSVNYSLNKIVSDRLGEVNYVMKSGERYFSLPLAARIGNDLGTKTSPVLQTTGIAVAGGGQKRINNVKIWGIDGSFDSMAGLENFYGGLAQGQVIISENLASGLGVKTGDEILLRLTRVSLIPLNAPFVSDRENIISRRFTVYAIAGRDSLGAFNLENSQTAPYNVFISIKSLNGLMEMEDKANLILISSEQELSPQTILGSVSDNWVLDDAGMELKNVTDSKDWQLSSVRVFIEESTAASIKEIPSLKYPVITYFVNRIRLNEKFTPYSFVSTLPDSELDEHEIIINSWLAEDLGAKAGDSLEMNYFVVGPLRELEVETAGFIVKSVVEMEGRFADKDLMPTLPGLSDAGNCRDWETGVPIDLESIRDKDEDYWDEWQGTPKAFISLSKAESMWKNRFGIYTGFRFSGDTINEETLKENILSEISPASLGFVAEPVLTQAEYAANEGIDFGQLFAGLSFFLLVSGILLSVLLLLLNLEFRKSQLLTLSSLGIPRKGILRALFTESILVAALGAALGLLLAVLYNQVVFSALNSIWKAIVRTDMLVVNITTSTLLTGFFLSLVISAFTIFIPLNRYLNRNFRSSRYVNDNITGKGGKHSWKIVFLAAGIAGISIIGLQLIKNEIENAGMFFTAGGLLLIAGIALVRYYLIELSLRTFPGFTARHLSIKNLFRNPARSMTIVILFALATFLVISTGSNRKDLFVNAENPSSGTGGFLYYAESTVPVLNNLNREDIRFQYGLESESGIVQFRKADGDDASCLNLNRIRQPQIIATETGRLYGRFSFVTRTPYLEDENPWKSLEKDLPGGLIPAIADETVIKWGLGMKVGDTLKYLDSRGEEMNLLLIGGLAPSIFQGKVIISQENFLKHFPQNSGTNIFLVEANPADSAVISEEFHLGLRDYGINMQLAAKRLVEFYSVTNTYLSIFIVMGAIGLLLGTIGLGILLYRSILERKNEIAILRAVGFKRPFIHRIISREYMILLLTGIGIGFITAIIATLPSLLSPNTGISVTSVLVILAILFLNGWFWIWLIARNALKNRVIYQSLRTE